MYMLNKRTLATAVVMAAATAPSAAYARVNLENGSPPAPPTVSRQPVQAAIAEPAQPASSDSSQGFQWDDAAIGAAGTLVLAGVGSGAAVARRRRSGPLAG